MQYRQLGNSGIESSVIGFGAWAIGGWMWGGADEEAAVGAVQASLDAGVNLIDTAPIYGYGRSEEIVGKAIAGRRDEVVLATKCGLTWEGDEGEFHFYADDKGLRRDGGPIRVFKNLRPHAIRRDVENSLRRLGTDYIDLLQTHWQDSTTPISATMDCLLELKREGKIRAIGVSNCTVAHLEQYGPIDSDQEKFSLIDRAIEANGVLDYCRRHNIAMLAYSPLANGLLTGSLSPDRQFGEGDLRRGHPRFTADNIRKMNEALAQLRPLAEDHHATVAQLVIAWTAARDGITVVLCGARNAVQALSNAAAAELRLRPDELALIERAVA